MVHELRHYLGGNTSIARDTVPVPSIADGRSHAEADAAVAVEIDLIDEAREEVW